jgi:hypothetical protein
MMRWAVICSFVKQYCCYSCGVSYAAQGFGKNINIMSQVLLCIYFMSCITLTESVGASPSQLA